MNITITDKEVLKEIFYAYWLKERELNSLKTTEIAEKFSDLLNNQISAADLFWLHTIEYLPKTGD